MKVYSTGWHHSEETKRKIGEKSKGRTLSKESRIKLSNSLKGRKHSEESRKKMSESRKGIIFSDTHKKRISEANRGRLGFWAGKKRDSYTISRVIEAHKGKKLTKEHKLKIQKSMLGKRNGENNPMYVDGRSRSRKRYCEKFNNEFRERVRSFFNYRCVKCLIKQNGKNLDVHHIHYQKKGSCCTENAPRKFVALCHSCHSKTNINRDYWISYFEELIALCYGNKTYYTKEEYAKLANKL